jgi:hypothetical protein
MWLTTTSAYTRTPAAWQVEIMDWNSASVPIRLSSLTKLTGWYMSYHVPRLADACGGDTCTAP